MLPPVIQIVESNMVVIPFVPAIEQICETNFNCLDKIPFQCSPCIQLHGHKNKKKRAFCEVPLKVRHGYFIRQLDKVSPVCTGLILILP